MTVAKILAAFEPWPALRRSTRMAFAVTGWTSRMDVISLNRLIWIIPVLASSFLFSPLIERFGTTHVVVGTTGILLNYVAVILLFCTTRIVRKDTDSVAQFEGPGLRRSLDGHPMSGLVRYLEFVTVERNLEIATQERAESATGVPSDGGNELGDKVETKGRRRLLYHNAADSAAGLCPCPLPTCAGNIPAHVVPVYQRV